MENNSYKKMRDALTLRREKEDDPENDFKEQQFDDEASDTEEESEEDA